MYTWIRKMEESERRVPRKHVSPHMAAREPESFQCHKWPTRWRGLSSLFIAIFLSSFSLSLHFPLLLARGMSPLWELTSHVRWLATGSPTHRPPTPGHGPIEPITPWGPSKWASHEDIKCRGGKAAIQMCGPHSKSPTQRSEQNMWRFHSTYHLPLARLLGLQWQNWDLGFR